jgi:hypothetical protein
MARVASVGCIGTRIEITAAQYRAAVKRKVGASRNVPSPKPTYADLDDVLCGRTVDRRYLPLPRQFLPAIICKQREAE